MTFVIILILIIIIVIAYYVISYSKMVHIKSQLDEKFYLVRDLPDKQAASNMLAKIKENIKLISNYLYDKIKNDPNKYKQYRNYIKQLYKNIQNTIITENDNNMEYTSYTVDKGVEIVFCLRTRLRGENNKLHDLNLVMYVVLHEISHVACPETGHTPLFKEIFEFILRKGIKLGIINYVDFSRNPSEYCGMTINEKLLCLNKHNKYVPCRTCKLIDLCK